MANDSTNPGQISSEQDATPTNEGYFADMQGDGDAFFGPEQLAQAATGGAPVVVPVPQDQNVIRVQVNPGEIIELSPPFDPGAALLGREDNGNLAIKVGDVTVILVGFVEANAQAPLVVETSDGQPIDIATLLASTDPAIDIQTAAGPGDAAQGQGADNTGGILSLLQGGTGLGGLNAVGAQDATQLSYGLIDNSIRLDREDALLGTSTSAFAGMHEPFLRDPPQQIDPSWMSFADFRQAYQDALDAGQSQTPAPGGWADYKGTEVDFSQSVDDFLAATSQTVTIAHTSDSPENLVFNPANFFSGDIPESNGEQLQAVILVTDPQTVFLVRPSDEAIIMVFHVVESGPQTGDFHVQAFLINRLDHPGHEDPSVPGSDSFQDVLAIEFQTYTQVPSEAEEPSQELIPGPTGSVDILDDAPVAHDVYYKSYYGDDNHAPGSSGDDGLSTLTGGGGNHATFTNEDSGTSFGYVDEDWLHGSKWDHNQGNKDQDNDPPGANSDPDHGDDLGRTKVTGTLNIDFGADGPAGAGGNDCLISKDPLQIALALDNIPDLKEPFLDANGDPLTSDGHELVVLEHGTKNGVEYLVVGYCLEDTQTPSSAAFFDFGELSGGDGGPVKVFKLTLNVDPDDDQGNSQFQDFKFELLKGIDQLNDPADPVETNTLLKFDVIGHDDDGDAVHSAINIQVNDDVPMVDDTCYISLKGGLESEPAAFSAALGLLAGGGFDFSSLGGLDLDFFKQILLSKDHGSLDEDWLQGGGGNDADTNTDGTGNHDRDGQNQSNAQQDGDDYGVTVTGGLLNVNFGGDGPRDTNAYALKTFDQFDTFEDADGNTYTTGQQPLVVLESSEGHLVIGLQGEGDALDKPIFELTLATDPSNPLFGGFLLVMYGPIDHTGQNEQSLNLHFDVTATDADGDTAIAAINVEVNDDKPEVAITYNNNLEHSFLLELPTETDGRLLAVVDTGDKTTDFGHVDEDFLKSGSISSGLYYTGNQDKDGNNTDNAGLYGDDIGKSEVTGQIAVKYGGDGPSGNDEPFGLKVYSGLTLTGPLYENADGATFKSGGKDLIVLASDSGHLLVGIAGHIGTGPEDPFIFPQKIFELDFNSGDGQFDFKLWGPIDHVPQAGPDGDETNSLLTFEVGSASDNDGDTVDAVIKIQVNDDHPEVGVEYTNNDRYSSTTVGIVDEDWILGPGNIVIGNGDTDSTPGDTGGKGTVFFDVGPVNYGGDGPGAGAGAIGFTAEEDDTLTVKDDNGTDHVLKTADGHTVLVHVDVDTGTGFGVLYGYFNSDDSPGYIEGTSVQVFSLSYNQSTNSGQFNLDRALQHQIADTEDNLLLTFGIKTGLTDADGDPAVATINIKVNDDGPDAVDDCEDIGTTEGNVITSNAFALGADKLSADGAKVTGASGAGGDESADIDGNTTVVGALGLLVISANGDWNYTLFNEDNKGSDIFEYTLTDGDGDTDTAQLIVTTAIVSDSSLAGLASFKEVGPTHEPAASYDHDVTVTGLNGIGNPFTSQTYHFEDSTGGHLISGGAGNDYINVSGSSGAVLSGNGGDDIIHAGNGANVINGGSGDDTLFGGTNADSFFGGTGHDAMAGGAGDDTFSKVDADDLDGTNTLDGVHSIDGGDGTDTVDLSVLKSFDSSQAVHLENIEHLAFDGKASGGGGTTVTLNYDAVYGVTQVGGLLAISGDTKDTVSLQASGGNVWHETGADTHVYEAGVGGSKVTVTVDHDIAVQLS